MEENNNKISAFQFTVICFFLISALFVGMGITIIFVAAKQNAWIVGILATVLSIIPIMILIYIINYQPKTTLFDKTKLLFGKIFGNIINFILLIFVLVMLVTVITSTTSFATTMYLTKTPDIYISGAFVAIAIYAVIKGIETIGRLCEILFFFCIIIILIIIFSLIPLFKFDELKPILTEGISPVIKCSLMYISYCLTPLFLLMVIPKDNIVKNKQYHKYLIGGIFLSLLHMFSIFFLIPGIISINLAELYRIPAYYVLRKISIGGINNVENFLSVHWFCDTFIIVVMCFYFINIYIRNTFKIKKEKYVYLAIIIFGCIVIKLPNYFFKNPLALTEFMEKQFPLFVSLVLFVFAILTCILIFIKKKKERKRLPC